MTTLKAKNEKGFTLLELLLAMGIAFLVFLVIYMAYFISQTFFLKGTDTIQEQMYVRTLFSKISDDLQFLSRMNYLSPEKNEIVFEIFNKKVIETDPLTNDKLVEGNTIIFSTKGLRDSEGKEFYVLQRKLDRYEWLQKFGHSLKPNNTVVPPGYPDDMADSKQPTYYGEYKNLLEQEAGREFFMQNISFMPYNSLGQEINEGNDYDSLKEARSVKIEVAYKIRGKYGETLLEKVKIKTASTTVHFVNLSIFNDEEQGAIKTKDPVFLGNLFVKQAFASELH